MRLLGPPVATPVDDHAMKTYDLCSLAGPVLSNAWYDTIMSMSVHKTEKGRGRDGRRHLTGEHDAERIRQLSRRIR